MYLIWWKTYVVTSLFDLLYCFDDSFTNKKVALIQFSTGLDGEERCFNVAVISASYIDSK